MHNNSILQYEITLIYSWHGAFVIVWHGIGYSAKHNKNFTTETNQLKT